MTRDDQVSHPLAGTEYVPVKKSNRLWCFFGVHSYEIHGEGPISYHRGGVITKKSRYYDLRCTCCGDMKTRIL